MRMISIFQCPILRKVLIGARMQVGWVGTTSARHLHSCKRCHMRGKIMKKKLIYALREKKGLQSGLTCFVPGTAWDCTCATTNGTVSKENLPSGVRQTTLFAGIKKEFSREKELLKPSLFSQSICNIPSWGTKQSSLSGNNDLGRTELQQLHCRVTMSKLYLTVSCCSQMWSRYRKWLKSLKYQ